MRLGSKQFFKYWTNSEQIRKLIPVDIYNIYAKYRFQQDELKKFTFCIFSVYLKKKIYIWSGSDFWSHIFSRFVVRNLIKLSKNICKWIKLIFSSVNFLSASIQNIAFLYILWCCHNYEPTKIFLRNFLKCIVYLVRY